jgi:probable HAF family extracellular repeat protein
MKTVGSLLRQLWLLLFVVPLSTAQVYTITDLGTLGGSSSWAYGINDFGQVVGYSCVDTNCNTLHAFSWMDDQGMQDLGNLPGGGNYSIANAVNNQGQVVGASDFSQPFEGNTSAFISSTQTPMQDLGNLGCTGITSANGVSLLGQVVGTSTISPCAGGGQFRAFSWTDTNGMQDLGTLPGGSFSIGNGANLFGQAVGYSDCSSCISYHAFLWTAQDGMIDLGTLRGGTQSSAAALNDVGTVVGTSDLGVRGFPLRAFSWTKQLRMRSLGTLPGGAWSSANAVSDFGQIVGISDALVSSSHTFLRVRNGGGYSDASHAFTWSEPFGMQDLNNLIPQGTHWILVNAQGVNNFGQVVGWGSLNGQTRAFLLTPNGFSHRRKHLPRKIHE